MSDTLSTLVGLSLPVLAQLAPAPDDRSAAIWWLVGLAAVAVAFNQIATAWGRLTDRFSSRPTGAGLVTDDRCRFEHEKVGKAMERIDANHVARSEDLRQEIKSDIKGVHARIDDVLRAVSDIGGQIKHLARPGRN